MKVFKTRKGIIIKYKKIYYLTEIDLDMLFCQDDAFTYILDNLGDPFYGSDIQNNTLCAPIKSQEVWASGVTYSRSKNARMEEAQDAGGGDFYDKVYAAERPELFFKSASFRVVGHMEYVRIRKDSAWNVPEPELTLVINARGRIIGYTLGNDMSSRDIEGQNPLYLPQAKTYDKSAALGPCIYLAEETLPPETEINLSIIRNKAEIFSGEIAISQIVRKFEDLVEYLFREMSFPYGCFLMTGTGIVPPNDFTLKQGDIIHIHVEQIGTLTNIVE